MTIADIGGKISDDVRELTEQEAVDVMWRQFGIGLSREDFHHEALHVINKQAFTALGDRFRFMRKTSVGWAVHVATSVGPVQVENVNVNRAILAALIVCGHDDAQLLALPSLVG